MPREPVFDDDNPEWTEEDFARARPPEEVLPPEILAQFPKTRRIRGPQKAPRKVQVAIRLSPDLVEHYRAGGRGFHGRIEAALRRDAGLAGTNATSSKPSR